MGFSADAKYELARLLPTRPCCRRAELSALARLSGVLRLGYSRPALVMAVEHPAVARLALTLFRLVLRPEAAVAVRRSRRLRRPNLYSVEVPPAGDVEGLLHSLGLLDGEGRFASGVPTGLLARRCCRKAYLRGVFLAKGSVTDPERGYHLELALTDDQGLLAGVRGVAEGFGLAFHQMERKGEQVLYLKDADEIAQFLGLLGASAAVLAFENVRVKRDVRNRVNRLVNAEAANLEKTAGAAAAQLEDIELIRNRLGLRALPRPLREVAEARLAHPEASLRELGALVSPPVGKSGASYRLRKLAALAERLRLESCANEGRNPERGTQI